MTTMKEHLGETEEPERDAPQPGTEPPKRRHRASYARDNKRGGYNIRVVGPKAAKFAGREVPVTTKAGGEHTEKLVRLFWTGTDRDTGLPAALYTFEQKPAEQEEELF